MFYARVPTDSDISRTVSMSVTPRPAYPAKRLLLCTDVHFFCGVTIYRNFCILALGSGEPTVGLSVEVRFRVSVRVRASLSFIQLSPPVLTGNGNRSPVNSGR